MKHPGRRTGHVRPSQSDGPLVPCGPGSTWAMRYGLLMAPSPQPGPSPTARRTAVLAERALDHGGFDLYRSLRRASKDPTLAVRLTIDLLDRAKDRADCAPALRLPSRTTIFERAEPRTPTDEPARGPRDFAPHLASGPGSTPPPAAEGLVMHGEEYVRLPRGFGG